MASRGLRVIVTSSPAGLHLSCGHTVPPRPRAVYIPGYTRRSCPTCAGISPAQVSWLDRCWLCARYPMRQATVTDTDYLRTEQQRLGRMLEQGTKGRFYLHVHLYPRDDGEGAELVMTRLPEAIGGTIILSAEGPRGRITKGGSHASKGRDTIPCNPGYGYGDGNPTH